MAILNSSNVGHRVLVSSVCGDVGGSVVTALSARGLQVLGCDLQSNPAVNHCLFSFFNSPSVADATSYVEWVIRTCVREGVEAFFPVSEQEIEVAVKYRGRFVDAGVKLIANAQLVVDTCLDKYATAQFLKNIKNVSVPWTGLLDEMDAAPIFSLVLKPRKGRGSKGHFMSDGPDDFAFYSRKLRGLDYVAQECVGSLEEEFTTAVFSDGSKTEVLSFKRKLGFGGMSVEVQLSDDHTLIVLGEAISRSMGLVGSINVQTRKVGGSHFVFEINPRISSTASFRRFFGFDDVNWWYDVAFNRSFQYQRRYSSGVGKRNFGEVYFDLSPVNGS